MNRLDLIQGDDQSIPIVVTNIQTGQGENITGWKFYFTVKYKAEDPDSEALIAIDVTDHIDPEHGESAIPITKEESTIAPGAYVYDIQAKDDLGNIITIVPFRICSIIPEVTRRFD